jgi:hypothetical protein
MLSSKKNLPGKGHLRQVFIRVYRLEIQSVKLERGGCLGKGRLAARLS